MYTVYEIIKKYEDSLSSFHREDCFWRHNSCPGLYAYVCMTCRIVINDKAIDEVYSFPLRTSSQALDLITTESRNFRACEDQLPAVEHPMVSTRFPCLLTFR